MEKPVISLRKTVKFPQKQSVKRRFSKARRKSGKEWKFRRKKSQSKIKVLKFVKKISDFQGKFGVFASSLGSFSFPWKSNLKSKKREKKILSKKFSKWWNREFSDQFRLRFYGNQQRQPAPPTAAAAVLVSTEAPEPELDFVKWKDQEIVLVRGFFDCIWKLYFSLV